MFPTPCLVHSPHFHDAAHVYQAAQRVGLETGTLKAKKKKKSHIFSSCLPKVSYQIYNFAKHQPCQF